MSRLAPSAPASPSPAQRFLAGDNVERLLALAATVLLGVATVALLRGRDQWGLAVSPAIAAHLLSVMPALALTPVMLVRAKGDVPHRALGLVWAALMGLTAASSFFIRQLGQGHLWWIHLLSAFTLVQLPRLVLSARRHQVAKHRSAVRWMVLGALLIAGVFTFPFGRLMGTWLTR